MMQSRVCPMVQVELDFLAAQSKMLQIEEAMTGLPIEIEVPQSSNTTNKFVRCLRICVVQSV